MFRSIKSPWKHFPAISLSGQANAGVPYQKNIKLEKEVDAMGNNAKIGGGGFHHIAIRVFDFDKTVSFYTEVLGFKEQVRWGEGNARAIMLDTGDGNYLEVFAGGAQGQKDEGAFLHLALRSDNVTEAIELARAAGMEVTVEPKDAVLGGVPVRIAFFKGPDGEIIELIESTGENKL
jgi:glyoxylase I family protein